MNLKDWERLAKGMSEDPRTCCLGSIFFAGIILFKVGLIGYLINHHSKPFLWVLLSAWLVWLLLYCCGWTVRSSMNPFANLPTFVWCCLTFVIVYGLAIPVVLALVSAYKADDKVSFSVAGANLTQFSLSNNMTTLDYNLTVEIVVGPNRKKHGVYYETLQARASYQGRNFTSLSVPPFYLGGKNNHTYNSSTVVLQPLLFQGRQDQLVLPPDGLKRYQLDEAAGRFTIDVYLSYSGFRGKHHLKGVKTFPFKELALPNASSGWIEQAGHDDSNNDEDPTINLGHVSGDIVGISLSAVIFLGVLCCCCCVEYSDNDEEDRTSTRIICGICLLLPLITIVVLIPDLVRALKKLDQIELSVSNATLARFDYLSSSSSTLLVYNLSVAVTVGPNHRKTGVYFDKLEAAAYYQGHNLTSLALSSFYLQGKQKDGSRTVILRPLFQGQQVLTLAAGGDGLNKFRKETAARRYSIVVVLSYSGIRTNDYNSSSVVNQTLTKAGHHKQLNGVATFDLKVPLLMANESSGAVSSGAAANVDGFNHLVLVLLLAFLICGSLYF